MFVKKKTASEKRESIQKALKSGRLLRFPGAFSPLVAILIEEIGFDGVYISGATLAADLGFPDIGMTTLPEVSDRGRCIARMTDLPAIIDMDTGFGEPMNAARSTMEIEDMGICGCHIEDQMAPKRCGHLDHKLLIDEKNMVRKIRACIEAKRDPNFLVIARTDARADEGLQKAIDRAKAYVDAGADAIFPEALQSPEEFEAFRQAVSVPLLANMTEFGKSPLLDADQLEVMGYNIVIYPVSTLRLALKAVEEGLVSIFEEGSQKNIINRMQTRRRLYEILQYESYNQFDQRIFNFKI